MASMTFSKQDLLELIERDSPRHIAFLQTLIRIPTPNPPGDVKKAVAQVQTYLTDAGVASAIIGPNDDSPNLVSVFRSKKTGIDDSRSHGRGPSIVLNGHIDQFLVEDLSQWQRDPYSGDVVDGFVHGRSGVDMKAGTAASIIAFRYLHDLRQFLSGRCTLEVVSGGKKTGRTGTRYLLEDDGREECRADCVLVGKPSGLDSINFGEYGVLPLTFNVTAPGEHGAYVHPSKGAVRIACRLINALLELEEADLEMDGDVEKYMHRANVRQTADEIMGPGAADAMSKLRVNIGSITGERGIGTIPTRSYFLAEFRVPIGATTAQVCNQIERVLQDGFPEASYEVYGKYWYEAAHSNPRHEIVGLLQRNAEAVRGKRPVPTSSLKATDCRHFRQHGIPAYAYGPHPRGTGEVDEKVSIAEFLDTVKVHTLTAWDYLGGPQ